MKKNVWRRRQGELLAGLLSVTVRPPSASSRLPASQMAIAGTTTPASFGQVLAA